MKISVEITLIPLHDDYKPAIKGFIKKLRNSEFTVLENPLSTQVYGDYHKVMPFLTETLEGTFKDTERVIANFKIVKSDRSNYEPSF